MRLCRASRLACAATVALSLPASGCQSILGIKDPVVGAGGPDGASGDGGSRVDARLRPSDGGAGNPDAPTYATPTLRDSVRMVYDSGRDRLVLFGGVEDATGAVLNDTWEWDGTGWTNVTPASGNPPARYAYMMAYDAARKRVVLFGGAETNNLLLDDTWEWDGKRWTDVTPTTSPPVRFAGGMVYDSAQQQVVLFGGSGNSYLNDTWAWDGTSWTNVTPGSGNPPGRQSFGMAYDAQSDSVVLVGGHDNISRFDNTWVWNGRSWASVGVGPSARSCDAMAYDSVLERVVLFGGSPSNAGTPLSDTWEWGDFAWSNVTPSSGTSPSGLFAGACDSALKRVILYSGGPDMWAWDGTKWSAL